MKEVQRKYIHKSVSAITSILLQSVPEEFNPTLDLQFPVRVNNQRYCWSIYFGKVLVVEHRVHGGLRNLSHSNQ